MTRPKARTKRIAFAPSMRGAERSRHVVWIGEAGEQRPFQRAGITQPLSSYAFGRASRQGATTSQLIKPLASWARRRALRISEAQSSPAAVPQTGISDSHHSRRLYQTRSPYTARRSRIRNCQDSPHPVLAGSTDPVWSLPLQPVHAREFAQDPTRSGSRSQPRQR
jgi:hypothetical protein